ncbi:MAG: xylulokinase [Paracoccaceae bacterium]
MFLGLDLGTSGLRGLLIDAEGRALDSAEASYSVAHPHPGWSEQDPADWISACRDVIAALSAKHVGGLRDLQGIGLSGHMHGATLLDENGAVLRPCMLWNDTRSHAQAQVMDAQPAFRSVTGNIVFPGFTAPKVQWVAENEPDIFSQIARILLPKDYLAHWLAGAHTSDMSDSAGTAWMDTGARAWSTELLDASGLNETQMPTLCEGSDVAGVLRADLAAELGLPAGIPVAAGGGDNAAAACGIGALNEGDGFVSLGTSGVLLAARDGFSPDAGTAVHTFCHAIPDTWYQMGVILAATDSLNWLASVLDSDAAGLTAQLGERIGTPSNVQFLPYLSGERTPHNDSAIRGAFVGLDIATTRADLTRAVLEGVSFALRDSLEALRATGADLQSVIAIGGGAQSRYWVELVATVLNLPVDLPEQGEFGAAMGAARLALCAATGANPRDVMTKPAIAETIVPNPDLRAAYNDAYANYRALYPALKGLT